MGWDHYGVPIGVNYRGNDSYKTRLGALLSIICNLLVLQFAIERGGKLIFREGPQITVTNEIIDYANDETPYDL